MRLDPLVVGSSSPELGPNRLQILRAAAIEPKRVRRGTQGLRPAMRRPGVQTTRVRASPVAQRRLQAVRDVHRARRVFVSFRPPTADDVLMPSPAAGRRCQGRSSMTRS